MILGGITMKKGLLVVLFVVTALFVTGCQEKPKPDDRLADYIKLWNDEKFSDMYKDYVTPETKKTYKTDDYVKRSKDLYNDLGIKNVKVTFDRPKDKEKKWDQKKPATFPIHVKMDTMAGPVKFDKDVTLQYEKQNDEENWYVKWDPSFIFPELEKGDKIRITTEKSMRGEIMDRNGNALAINGTGYEVGVTPSQLTDEASKASIAKLLGTTTEFIDSQMNQSWVKPDYFVPIKQLSSSQKGLISKITAIPGVSYQEVEMREYPYKEALSHLTGYIGKINAEELKDLKDKGYTESDYVGKRGLEQLLEDKLHGQDGVKIFIEKKDGVDPVTIAEKDPQNGETIKLTINAELQKIAYNAMKGQPGTSAAVDPKTGETLVLTSSPGFDPNEFVLGVSNTRYKELQENPNQPLLNRFAVSYAPGSTQKPLTASIGMKAGKLDPNKGYIINGLNWQKDKSWGSYKITRVHAAPNPVNLEKGLVFSDNIYFARAALDMGNETFVKGLEHLGYGEKLPFSYPLRASQISNDGKIDKETQLADTAYGQGQMLTNILHLATMYEIFLNDGTMIKPTLFMDEKKGEVWKKDLISAKDAAIIRTDLRKVVTDGFAQPANVASMKIAGKTGTAELKAEKGEKGKENGFFVAYDQANPKFLLAMMIESVQDKGGSTHVSGLAADVFVKDKKLKQP